MHYANIDSKSSIQIIWNVTENGSEMSPFSRVLGKQSKVSKISGYGYFIHTLIIRYELISYLNCSYYYEF